MSYSKASQSFKAMKLVGKKFKVSKVYTTSADNDIKNRINTFIYVHF